MKKILMFSGLAVLVLVVAAFAGVAYVNAQAPVPTDQGAYGPGYMMGGNTAMREYMHAALAEKLGMTVEELEEQVASGVTVWQLAQEKGLTDDEIVTLMSDARSQALDQMLADGVITQEQADWMKQRGGSRMGGRGAQGGCPMFTGGTTGTFNRGQGRRGSGMMGGNW